MNKKIISYLMILVLLGAILPMNGVVYADDLERTITLDNYKVLKGSFEEVEKRTSKLNDLMRIEKKGEEAISKRVGKANDTKKLAKISKGLEKQLSMNRKDEKIEVLVMSKWNVNEDSFIKCIESIVQKTKYEKVKFNTVRMMLSKSQIQRFAKKGEIFRICLPEENKNINFITIEDENDEAKEYTSDKTRLNASTEMLGVEKARQDFNVTGDLDGDETSYSKNDIVICVVDTGIDRNHVDLDDGKIIGWYDAVSGKTKAYDDDGHGSHVASIAAGTGEGDSGIQEGTAPGAALVGVKVLDSNGDGTFNDMLDGLQWVRDNIDTYNIKVVNISIGTHAEYDAVEDIINMIEEIEGEGVAVFVAAGNAGDSEPYYNSLSTYAEHVSTSVGSVRDPYKGGWCLSKFSSRGTGTVSHPYILSCGEKIRAVDANTSNEYTVKSGTSMATPSITGIYALMYNAAYNNGGGTISFTGIDMGEEGVDKNYGGGRVAAYTSIKRAAGFGNNNNYTFNDYRSNIIDPSNTIEENYARVYEIMSSSDDADLNISAIVLNESTSAPYDKVMIAVWEPGKNPYNGDSSTYLQRDTNGIPQTHLTIPANEKKQGKYYIAIIGQTGDNINYTLEISGHEISPAR